MQWRSGPTHLGECQIQLADGIAQSLYVQLLETLSGSQLLSGRPVKHSCALVVRRAVVPKGVDFCQLQFQVAPQLAVEGDAVLWILSRCRLTSCCGKQRLFRSGSWTACLFFGIFPFLFQFVIFILS